MKTDLGKTIDRFKGDRLRIMSVCQTANDGHTSELGSLAITREMRSNLPNLVRYVLTVYLRWGQEVRISLSRKGFYFLRHLHWTRVANELKYKRNNVLE